MLQSQLHLQCGTKSRPTSRSTLRKGAETQSGLGQKRQEALTGLALGWRQAGLWTALGRGTQTCQASTTLRKLLGCLLPRVSPKDPPLLSFSSSPHPHPT